MKTDTDALMEIAAEEYARMPERFARRVKNVALLIEDQPDAKTRAEEGLAEGETLLGLYRGIPAIERGEFYSHVLPDTITLYRLPLLEEAEALLAEGRAADFGSALREAVRETLWHEIAHHFGMSEAEVHEREAARTNAFDYAQPAEGAPHAPQKGSTMERATFSFGRSKSTASMAKILSLILGAILALIGLLGFVNNSLIGANALFAADAAHDVLHLILGGALIAVALRMPESAMVWMKIIGAVLFLIGLIGLIAVPSAGGVLFGIVFTNGATNWMHLLLGACIFAAGAFGIETKGGAARPL